MTARRRAGQTRTTPFTDSAAQVPITSTSTPPDPGAGGTGVVGKPSKYTALLDAETAEAFDELALIARRKLGRKIDKSTIIRVLIRMASDDPSVRERMLGEVGKRA